MTAEPDYKQVIDLVKSIQGTMTYQPGGGPGGIWELSLHGRRLQIACRDRNRNDLDDLYELRTGITDARTWADYEEPGRLKQDAFWLLMGLFTERRQ